MEQALRVPFRVLNSAGEVVATGMVDGEPMTLPAGTYRVEVLTRTPLAAEGVLVRGDQLTTLETDLVQAGRLGGAADVGAGRPGQNCRGRYTFAMAAMIAAYQRETADMEPDPAVVAKLEQVSGKFRELKQRAMAEVQRRMARVPGPAEGEQSTDAV